MKALKYILLLLLIVIIGLAIFIAVQPADYSFSRSRIIQAPQSLLFDKVNDYKNWPQFSPWFEQEPEAKITYKSITKGEGAGYGWNGEILGIGNMETLSSNLNTSINQKIEFIEPFTSGSDIRWTFKPVKTGTEVTWAMQGKKDFVSKAFTAFMGSIEKNTGPDFERGLFKLDSITRAEMEIYTISPIETTQHSGGFYLYNTTSCKISEFDKKMAQMLPKIGGYAISNTIRMAGAPFVIYHKWDEENNAAVFSCAIPTSSKITSSESDILTGQLQPFKAIKTTLTGNFKNLREAWDKAMKYAETNNLEVIETGPMIEAYITDPSTEQNPAKWVTEIYVAIK